MKKVLLNAKTGMNSWEDVYVPTADALEGIDVEVADLESATSDEKAAINAAIEEYGWRNVSINGYAVIGFAKSTVYFCNADVAPGDVVITSLYIGESEAE